MDNDVMKFAEAMHPQRIKILVVENDPDLVYILGEVFADACCGYKIVNEALNLVPLAIEFKPDIVLLDFKLPLTNGGELCRQLKSHEETKSIPVIIYSAASTAFLSVKDYGHDLFIPKPFDIEYLMSKIHQLTSVQSDFSNTPSA